MSRNRFPKYGAIGVPLAQDMFSHWARSHGGRFHEKFGDRRPKIVHRTPLGAWKHLHELQKAKPYYVEGCVYACRWGDNWEDGQKSFIHWHVGRRPHDKRKSNGILFTRRSGIWRWYFETKRKFIISHRRRVVRRAKESPGGIYGYGAGKKAESRPDNQQRTRYLP